MWPESSCVDIVGEKNLPDFWRCRIFRRGLFFIGAPCL